MRNIALYFLTTVFSLLLVGSNTSLQAQDGTIVFDQEIEWKWSPTDNPYGGYGFYWWHQPLEGMTNFGNMSATDWVIPEDYYNGEFQIRFEIVSQPTSEPFYIQFGIWQDKDKGTAHPETVSSRQYVSGGNGIVLEETLGSPQNWWNKENDDLVDFTRPEDFYRIGLILWNADPLCIPKGEAWGDDGCPEYEGDFFPMTAKVTVTAYSSSEISSYTANFTVKDQNNVPQQGATIEISGNTLTTDGNGNASVQLINGNYNYKVSKSGFETKWSSLTISGADVSENVTIMRTYPITFDIDDPDSNPVEGAVISIDGENLTTNSSGNASINLPNGSYPYTINKPGFEEETGTISVTSSGKTENVSLNYITYNVSFNVTNPSSDPIENANISIDGSNLTTDATGNASINLSDGSYSFTVSAGGYMNYDGSVNVSGSNITENVQLSEAPYTVTFNVSSTGSGESIEGAEISINSTTLTTDASGVASIALANGDYPYSINLAGYETETGTVSVAGASITEDVMLTMITHTLTFIVTNQTSDPLENVSISIDGNDLNTDVNGEAALNLPDGEYNYTASKSGYGSQNGIVNIAGENFTENISLSGSSYTAKFVVFNQSSQKIQGAEITVDGTTITTNSLGEATVDLVNGEYPYTVTASGYGDTGGTLNVEGQNLTENIVMPLKSYILTFSITDGSSAAMEGANISIDGNNLTTNASGEATVSLTDGDYSYTVSKTGFGEESGSVTIAGSDKTESVSIYSLMHTITFKVMDEAGTALDGAVVNIGGTEKTTGSNGEVSFDREDGTYSYSVSMQGYEDKSGTVAVSGSDVSEDVNLSLLSYILSFVVTDSDGSPLEGAEITIGDENKTTSSTGQTLFNKVNGTYTYTITKDGYESVSNSVTISDANHSELVSLTESTWTLTFYVTNEESDPLSGVTIAVADQVLTTNSAGQASIDLTNGDYDYTAIKDDYKNATGSVSISGKTSMVEVSMQAVVSVKEFSAEEISVYPNPASEMMTVKSVSAFRSDTEFSLYNISGRKIYSINSNGNSGNIELNLSEIPDGVYFLYIRSESNVITKKILIQK